MGTHRPNTWTISTVGGGRLAPLRTSPMSPVILEMDETETEPDPNRAADAVRLLSGRDEGDGPLPRASLPARARSDSSGRSNRTNSLAPVHRVHSPSLERIIDSLLERAKDRVVEPVEVAQLRRDALTVLYEMLFLVRARICVYLSDNTPVDFIPTAGYQCRTPELIDSVAKARNFDLSQARQTLAVWFSEETSFLEVQLKPTHNPFVIQKHWKYFLRKYSDCEEVENSNALLFLRRSVFLSVRKEAQLTDHHLLHLLFEEAKSRFLGCRYLFSVEDVLILGTLLIYRLHGRYTAGSDFLSTVDLRRFFPSGFLMHRRLGARSTPLRLVDLIKDVYEKLSASSLDELRTRFLLICRDCPLYGAAFFHGLVDEAPRGRIRAALFGRTGTDVTVAVNERGLFLIPAGLPTNPYPEILLALPYGSFQFHHYQPPDSDVLSDAEIARLLLTFRVPLSDKTETEWTSESRQLFVFSKQAALIDACLRTFVQKRRAAFFRRRESIINGDDSIDSEFGSDGLKGDFAGSSELNGHLHSPVSFCASRKKTVRAMKSVHFPSVTNRFDKFLFYAA